MRQKQTGGIVMIKNPATTIWALIFMVQLSFLTSFLVALDKTSSKGSITGRVIDSDTLFPLLGVYITIDKLTHQAVSGENGEYTFEDVPSGNHTLQFQFSSSRPLVIHDVIVKPDRFTILNVRFKIQVETHEEMTVQAGLFQDQKEEPEPTMSFSQEEVRRNPSSGGDVARIVATLPSVTQLNDQKNSLIVRGSSPDENLYVIDNIEVPAISHFPFQGTGGGAISLINVDFLDQVSFSPGGFSAMYGDKMSSVTQLSFRDGSRNHFNSQMSLDMVGIGAITEGPLFSKNASWMLSYRHSYADLITKMMKTGVTPGWSDLQGKLSWDINNRHCLIFIGLAGWDESDFIRDEALKTGQDFYGLSKDNSLTLGVNWFALWGPAAYSDTSISFSRINYFQDWSWTHNTETATQNISQDTRYTIRHQTTINLTKGHRLRFGGQAQLLLGDYRYFAAAGLDALGHETPHVQNVIQSKANKTAFFSDWTIPLSGFVSLTIGFRGDYFSSANAFSWSPRINLTLPLSSRLSLDLYSGYFYQHLPLLMLTQNELNKTLNTPLCRQVGGALTWQINASNQFTLAFYGKFYKYLPVDPLQKELCLLDEQFNQFQFSNQALDDTGEGRAFGLEITWQKKLSQRFHGLVNLALSSSKYRNNNQIWRSRISDRQYLLNLVGGYKVGKTWDLSARWLIAGGVPYTPFDLIASQDANYGIYDQNLINRVRHKPYHSLNLTLDKRFFFSGSSLTLNLSLWNAYNNDNTAFLFWNRVENRQDVEKQWSFMPIVGIEYEF